MPRAFLITRRRYNGTEEFEQSEDYRAELGVRVAEYGNSQPTSDGGSDYGSETSSECPEELYNLTKLAEVSLAAAAGTLIHPNRILYQPESFSSTLTQIIRKSSTSWSSEAQHQSNRVVKPHENLKTSEEEDNLREETKLFFERIETERVIQERSSPRTSSNLLDVRITGKDSHYPINQRDHLSTSSRHSQELEQNLTSSPIISSDLFKRTTSALSETSKSEESEEHECPDCGKKYSTSSNLARHRQTHRSLGDKKARRCPHCDKVYVSIPAFSMHVRTHNQGCKCHYCGKCFSRPWLLQGHIRTHTGEKPFKCTICDKAFADKSNLRAHIQTHSNTKPHICSRCGKAFALKSYLYKHEESSCMRYHNRTPSDKRDDTEAQKSNTTSNSLSPPPDLNKILTSCMTASPTSVIVPRLQGPSNDQRSSSAFSAIIKHTKTPQAAFADTESSIPTKRSCQERTLEAPNCSEKDKSEYLSRMVIRTSVISPNPERFGQFVHRDKETSPFDFTDPSRTSAFLQPTEITLNLAIA